MEVALMQMRIAQDDAVILTLSSTDAGIRRYAPRMPEMNISSEQLMTDGEAVLSAPYRNVTEQVDLYWEGTRDQQLDRIASMQRLLQIARHRQNTGIGPRVYVHFRLADGDDWYRSEILAGRLLVDDARYKLGLQAIQPHFESTLIWTRKPYWEYAADDDDDSAALELPLNGYPGGMTVSNDDGNTLDIAGEDVEGTLPAPLRLEITNSTSGASRSNRFYIARNLHCEQTVTHHFDGFTTNAVGTTETLLKTVDLTGEQLADWGGAVCRIMALVQSLLPSTLWLRWKLYWAVTALWTGPWINSQYYGLKDMNALALPPRSVYGATEAYPMELRLYGRNSSAGGTYTYTWLQILPVDSWRSLIPAGYGMAYGVRLVDDGILDEIWTDGWDGGGYTTHYSARGNPVMVDPGRDQRLYVLCDTATGTSIDGRTSLVKAFYRPRRLTL